VPAEPGRSTLQATIVELAAQLEAPPFLPHVTLATVDADAEAIRRAFDEVARDRPPLRLVAGPTTHSDDWKRTLVIEFGDPRIDGLAGTLCDLLGRAFDPSELRPHLSLLYKRELPRGQRAALASRYVFEGDEFEFDTLVVMHAPGGVDDVLSWDTSLAVTFAGR
jgi:hypothetical protein